MRMTPLFLTVRLLQPILCAFIPCIIYQIILYRRWKHHGTLSKANLLWRYILIFYLSMVMTAVRMGSIWDIVANGLVINWDQINLVPFGSEAVMTYLLNIVLLMPLGFLLPFIWNANRTFSRTLLAGFLLSLSIELGQLVNYRLTDIDDIMMNVLGTAVGFGLWALFHKRFQTKPKEADIFADQPLVYLLLVVLGNFFLESWRLTVHLNGGIMPW